MTRYPQILASLLLLGAATCANAQSPLVYINQGANQCVVTPGDPIFKLDTTGNVLITGSLSGPGCGGATTSQSATFIPFNPAPATLGVNGSSASSVLVGTGTASVTYSAYFATSCSVSSNAGTATPSGSCPALSTVGTSCTGTGSQLSCTPANGKVNIPASLPSGVTSCAYALSATCQPGGATSSASLTVNSTGGGGGGGGIPVGCETVAANLGTGVAGAHWNWLKSGTVLYGNASEQKSGVDLTSYVSVWNTPESSAPWPNVGLNLRVTVAKNNYLSERFTVPSDGSVSGYTTWGNTGSGNLTSASYAVSTCPGDFGQAGTTIPASELAVCRASSAQSGFSVVVSATAIAGSCTVKPGQSYYLNVLSQASLPNGSGNSVSNCPSSCTPWTSVF